MISSMMEALTRRDIKQIDNIYCNFRGMMMRVTDCSTDVATSQEFQTKRFIPWKAFEKDGEIFLISAEPAIKSLSLQGKVGYQRGVSIIKELAELYLTPEVVQEARPLDEEMVKYLQEKGFVAKAMHDGAKTTISGGIMLNGNVWLPKTHHVKYGHGGKYDDLGIEKLVDRQKDYALMYNVTKGDYPAEVADIYVILKMKPDVQVVKREVEGTERAEWTVVVASEV